MKTHFYGYLELCLRLEEDLRGNVLITELGSHFVWFIFVSNELFSNRASRYLGSLLCKPIIRGIYCLHK